jgi:hypothetical protein
MGIELIILKSMFVAAAIGFAVQQIISVNRELRKDAETAEARKTETPATGPAAEAATARTDTAQPAPAARTAETREPAEVA